MSFIIVSVPTFTEGPLLEAPLYTLHYIVNIHVFCTTLADTYVVSDRFLNCL